MPPGSFKVHNGRNGARDQIATRRQSVTWSERDGTARRGERELQLRRVRLRRVRQAVLRLNLVQLLEQVLRPFPRLLEREQNARRVA